MWLRVENHTKRRQSPESSCRCYRYKRYECLVEGIPTQPHWYFFQVWISTIYVHSPSQEYQGTPLTELLSTRHQIWPSSRREKRAIQSHIIPAPNGCHCECANEMTLQRLRFTPCRQKMLVRYKPSSLASRMAVRAAVIASPQRRSSPSAAARQGLVRGVVEVLSQGWPKRRVESLGVAGRRAGRQLE